MSPDYHFWAGAARGGFVLGQGLIDLIRSARTESELERHMRDTHASIPITAPSSRR
jgi:hypothetical protein